MKIYILGCGGVGSFLAGTFQKNNFDVTVVSDNQITHSMTMVINDKTVNLKNFYYQNKVYEQNGVVFLCCKASKLDDAIKKIPESFAGWVVSLQNGLGFHNALMQKFPKFVPGTIGKIIATRTFDKVIVNTQAVPEISICIDGGGRDSFFDFISKSGLNLVFKNSINELIWEKYSRLALFSLLTTYYQMPIGEILRGIDTAEVTVLAVSEIVNISASQGFDISSQTLIEYLNNLPKNATSSLSRDIFNKKKSEYNYILKPLLDISQKENILSCHINKLCKEIERKWDIK